MRIVQVTTDSREHFKDYGRPEPYFGMAPEALLSGFAELPGVEVHVVSCLRQPVAASPKLADNIFYHPLLVPKSGWMSTLYQGCVRSVRSVLRDIRPDIVHGQGTERDCAFSAVHSGYPNVVTIHGNMAEIERLGLHGHPWYGKAASVLENHTLRRTRGVFCNSRYTEELVAPRTPKTWRVPNAIRSAFFKARIDPETTNLVPVLVNIGLVCPRKRQLDILLAARELAEQGYKFKIIFIGHFSTATSYGSRFGEALAHAETYGYASYGGVLETEPLIDLLDRSHGFIHFPSEEAFGLVVAEAFARGLKFFGADLGGVKDIATGIPGAELYESIDGIKTGIARWLKAGAPRSPEAADEMARLYAPAVVAARHVEIYQEVLGR
ncbi:glycosyltransferase family 4 protein [Akkermansiaceae bacterium]|nr:glycosyltransferase family 4 protein [Akkermansiaceae bacterium]